MWDPPFPWNFGLTLLTEGKDIFWNHTLHLVVNIAQAHSWLVLGISLFLTSVSCKFVYNFNLRTSVLSVAFVYFLTFSLYYWLCMRYDSRWLDNGQALFLRVSGPRQSWGRKHAKKEWSLSSHVDQTSFVDKEIIIWKKKTISCGTQWVISKAEWERQHHLLAWVANHCAGFNLACLLTEWAILQGVILQVWKLIIF